MKLRCFFTAVRVVIPVGIIASSMNYLEDRSSLISSSQSGGCDMSFLWSRRLYEGVTDFLVGAIVDPLLENDNRPGSGGDFP